MKGDPDPDRVIIPGQHLVPEQRCHQRSHPLLAVDQDPLPGRWATILQLHRRISPSSRGKDRHVRLTPAEIGSVRPLSEYVPKSCALSA
jgi:hypothetical protein